MFVDSFVEIEETAELQVLTRLGDDQLQAILKNDDKCGLQLVPPSKQSLQ